MNNKDKIREACIKANPEIVELKFGCVVNCNLGELYFVYDEGAVQNGKVFNPKDGFFCLYDPIDGRTVDPFEIDRKSVEIIGRQLQLADVLLAIEDSYSHKVSTGSFEKVNGHVTSEEYHVQLYFRKFLYLWNLKKPFDEQSEELYEFVVRLV